jgi:polar amino acid transport system substrate-binding protein
MDSQSGYQSSIGTIVKRGELIVGMTGDMPPLNMTTWENKVIGLDVDLANRIAGALGVKLRVDVMSFSELIPALQAGKVDMVISGMTITPARNAKVAFAGPYFESGKALLTKLDTLAKATDPAEINSDRHTFVTLNGSTSQYFVEEVLPEANLVTTTDYEKAVQMVLEDKAQAMVADYPVCLVALLQNPDAGLVSLVTSITYEPLGIALPPNDPHLLNLVQNMIVSLEDSGKLEQMTRRWFDQNDWVSQLR